MADNQTLSDAERDAIAAEFAGARKPEEPSFDLNPLSHVKHLIGVVSGKGGVGKSMVTGILATEFARAGHKVGILDCDITGPSIPKMFGLSGQHLTAMGNLMVPAESKGGIKVVSTNLVLEHEDEPVIWRGPMLGAALRQFWADAAWGDIDYMFCDMPPGTGDVALTVFQNLPIEGVVIVTSPQDLVKMVVGKAVNMASMMEVPVIGLVENMSYLECPHCGERIEPYGPSHLDETAELYGLDVLGRLPIDPRLAASADAGTIEDDLPQGLLPEAVTLVENLAAFNEAKGN